jgi:hypothetical protein
MLGGRIVIPAAALASTVTLVAAPFKATLSVPTHTPKLNAKVFYTVRATDLAGKPIRAALTVQIVDPFGGVHPVTYADTNKPIVRRPFLGSFRDYIQFTPDTKGFRVTVRVTVIAKGAKIVRTWWMKAR